MFLQFVILSEAKNLLMYQRFEMFRCAQHDRNRTLTKPIDFAILFAFWEAVCYTFARRKRGLREWLSW
jgi:hypothetical protein